MGPHPRSPVGLVPPQVREKTDALDAAGNTTAAIGKGFAIGSATLVGLALFGAFVTRLGAASGKKATVDLLEPLTFAGLLVGSMLPYWFSAMTMKSVGLAANAMVMEIKRQFDANPNLLIPNHPDRTQPASQPHDERLASALICASAAVVGRQNSPSSSGGRSTTINPSTPAAFASSRNLSTP